MEEDEQNGEQVTTLCLFKLRGFKNKWWGLISMWLGHIQLKKVDGLSFYKLMGSGAANGFSIKPDWGTYALLCVWGNEKLAHDFLTLNSFFQKYKQKTSDTLIIHLKAIVSKGAWNGKQPFKAQVVEEGGTIAVITRATIRLGRLYQFWKNVPNVSEAVNNAPGRKLSIGIGEWPLIQQATFSIWGSQEQMMEYAYRSKQHSEVIKKTRELDWFSEELFARFKVLKVEGDWLGFVHEVHFV